MPGQRRPDHQLGGFNVARLADQDDIWILPEKGTQTGAEGESDVLLDLRLANARHADFDRVLQGEDAQFH